MATLTIIVPPGTPSIIFDGDTYTSNVTAGVVKNRQYTINSSDGTSNFWYWSGTGINLPASNSQNTIVFVTGNTATLEVNYLNQPTPTPTSTPTPTPTSTPTPTPTPTPTGGGSNYWYFYAPEGLMEVGGPSSNGQVLFSNNVSGDTEVTYNPNKTGGIDFINFCLNDENGVSFLTQITNLQTNGGTLSVTQNGITATYTVTTNMTFINSGGGFVSINVASSTQTVIASSPFTYADPISITFGS